MANIGLTPTWENDIYQLETSDAVLGGATGIANRQALQLGNRTEYLKAAADSSAGSITTINGTLSTHNTRLNTIENSKFQLIGDNFVRGNITYNLGSAVIDANDYGKLITLNCTSSTGAVVLPSLSGIIPGSKFSFIIYASNSVYQLARVNFYTVSGNIQYSGYLSDFVPGDSIVFTVKDASTWIVSQVSKRADIGYPGMVEFFATSSPPPGWIAANGAAISRTAYSRLYSAIGNTFGSGDGSTTFNIPDLRGYFIRGFDAGRGIDSGRIFGSDQTDDFKSHTHTLMGWHYDQIGGGVGRNVFQDDVSGSTAKATSPTGGTETRPVNIALLGCIKY